MARVPVAFAHLLGHLDRFERQLDRAGVDLAHVRRVLPDETRAGLREAVRVADDDADRRERSLIQDHRAPDHAVAGRISGIHTLGSGRGGLC